MFRFLRSGRGVALLVGVVVVGVVAVGGFAYFSAGGSGSGGAKVGGLGASGVVIHLAVSMPDGLVPGSGVGLGLAATNDSSTTNGFVGSVSLASPVAVTDVSASPNAGCVAYLASGQADFSLSPSSVVENVSVPPHDVSTPLTGATLNWANSSSQDQTGCVGESLRVAVVSS